MSTIIHIDGIQGAGKTYVCERLKKVVCIDSDEIYQRSYYILKNKPAFIRSISQHNKKWLKMMTIEENKIRDELIHENSDKILVFSGMTIEVAKPDYKFSDSTF